jgi:hypothetical protein
VRRFRPRTRNALGRPALAIARLKTSIDMSVEQIRRMQQSLRERRSDDGKG